MMMTLTFTAWESKALRCYIDLEATRVRIMLGDVVLFLFETLSFQSGSLECGMATGCVKILKKAYEFDHLGKFIPENKRGKDVYLFRGELSLFHFHTNGLQTFTLIIFWIGNGFNFFLRVDIIFE